jgi:amino acid transporter
MPLESGYRRELGPFSATMLIAGSMIGSGIFSVSLLAIRETTPTQPRQQQVLADSYV